MNPTNFETNSSISLLGSSLLVRASEGRTLHAFGHAVVVLLDGKQTGEKFTAFSISVRRAAARGRITTNEKMKWFYIVEGHVSFLINGTWVDVFPGDCVYSPRGSVHAFKNKTDQPIRVFINIAPAGFERFFAEVAEEWAQPETRHEPHRCHFGEIRNSFRVKLYGLGSGAA